MLRNIIEETANPPGAATTFALNGSTTGRLPWIHPQSFASLATVFYAIEGLVSGTLKVEWGVGKVTVGPPTVFERTTVIGNSDGTTTRLNFTGSVRVYNEVPAERVVYSQPAAGLRAPATKIGAALWATATGGPNDWVVTTPLPDTDTLPPGATVIFKATAASTGAVTVNVDGGGALALLTNDGAQALGAGDITLNMLVMMVWDGANWRCLNATARSLIPVGTILFVADTALTTQGWIPCDGRNVSRASYPRLRDRWQAINFPFGIGNGSTTMGVPDLRGRALFGRDNLGGTLAGRLNAVAWANFLSASATQIGAVGGDQHLQAHGHGYTDPGHLHGVWMNGAGDHQHLLNWGSFNDGGGTGRQAFMPFIGGDTAGTQNAGTHAHDAGTYSNGIGITIGTSGNGSGNNVPPAMICDVFVFGG